MTRTSELKPQTSRLSLSHVTHVLHYCSHEPFLLDLPLGVLHLILMHLPQSLDLCRRKQGRAAMGGNRRKGAC